VPVCSVVAVSDVVVPTVDSVSMSREQHLVIFDVGYWEWGVGCVVTTSADVEGVDVSSVFANLLTLNSPKTEFLLIGLKKQLDKIHNSSLNTTHSARNLGFIFDEHLTFSDQISAISKACYYYQTASLYPSLP